MKPVGDGPLNNSRSSFVVFICVALISAALIAYEIVLMRRLLIERWHHFGFLVISVALLGFGVSGTLLAVVARRVRERPMRTMRLCAAALAVGLISMPRIAALLPVSARFIPDDLWRQIGWWSLYWLTTLVPFLAGATLLGAALMTAGEQVGRVYAANLFGSGIGAAGAALVVSRLPIEYAFWPSIVLTIAALATIWCGGLIRGGVKRTVGLAATVVATIFVLAGDWWRPLTPMYDEHKYAARLEHLVAQGSARQIAACADPHGYVEIYESGLFHDLPFLALRESPPPMYSLVVNGDPAGSALRIDDEAEASVLDGTLMAFPYQLVSSAPDVLLIGETGGANVWLARRRAAASVDVVQPNAAVVSIVRTYSPAVFESPRVRTYLEDPRAFLARVSGRRYDLIQVVSLEGFGQAATGMRGLAEDHLATVEGLADCLRALRKDGLLAISRGIQHPPRENVRLFATLVEALELLGVADPSRHVIQVRDYLGVCTMASRTPLSDARRRALRTAIQEFNLTPIWYEGLPVEEVNRPDTLDGPPGTHVDWLHHAASEILSQRRGAFYDAWLLNVRPPHDDDPFFWDFYKPGAVAVLKEAYGDLWLTRVELGRLFLYASLLITAAVAVGLILVPLAVAEWKRRKFALGSGAGKTNTKHGTRTFAQRRASAPGFALSTVVYFGGIGLGFMGIEMALISRAIRYVGDPVIASALVIGGVLVMSGVGSLTGRGVLRGRTWLAPASVAGAAVLTWLLGWTGTFATPWLLGMVAIGAAYLMGMPMPAGIAALDTRSPRLVPWAWGVNGVASVFATSAAIAVAMTSGYRTVMLLAATAYLLAAFAGVALTRPRQYAKRSGDAPGPLAN